MRLVESVGDLDGCFDRILEWKRSFLQSFGQRHPFKKFHDDVVDVVMLTDIENGADVRMAEAGQRLRLALESRSQLGTLGKVFGKDLDCDEAIEARVSRFVDLAESSCADRLHDL